MGENPFKKLAGQTVVYGLGTILPRLLNYLLVPLYTRVFVPGVYGQFTELYAYIALLLALLTYGMETTFFRHGQGDNFRKVYGNIMTMILSTTALFVVLAACLHPMLAGAIGYEGKEVYLLFVGLIVAVDAINAVPFCVLRQQDKAARFSVIKLVNVLANVSLNVLFLLVIPDTSLRWANALFGPEAGLLTWVFVCNLVACLVNTLMLVPQFRQIKLQRDTELMRKLLRYAIPIMLISLIGMVNEVADKLAVKYLLPEDVAMSQLGVYGACYKLAVLMTIFVQMFRFASEPFFFAKAKDRQSPDLFADVMTYYVICGLVIFLCIVLYMDLFSYFVGGHSDLGEQYRQGLGIVPIVLLANLFYGVVFNLSIWYKLSDRTSSGTVITAVGAVVTVACLFGLVPVVGYWGAAWAHLACYSVMMIVSYVWGQKVRPIPYRIKRIGCYFLMAMGIYFLSSSVQPSQQWLMYVLNTIYLLAFCTVCFVVERKHRIAY